ncbi:MAG: tetratricopeptide repeat protein [Nitrospira sp.]|nr:tetratricopeptide repeat protein [Nitrospira sp.]
MERVLIGVVGVGLAVMISLPGCERRQPPVKVKQESLESMVEALSLDVPKAGRSTAETAVVLTGPEGSVNRAENEDRRTHASQDYWDAAEGHIHKALAVAPTLAEVQFNLALTLAKLGKHDKAKEVFKKAAELASTNLETTDSWSSRNTRVRDGVRG